MLLADDLGYGDLSISGHPTSRSNLKTEGSQHLEIRMIYYSFQTGGGGLSYVEMVGGRSALNIVERPSSQTVCPILTKSMEHPNFDIFMIHGKSITS